MATGNVEATIDDDIQELEDFDFLELVKREATRRSDEDYFNLKTPGNYSCTDRQLLKLYLLMEDYD